MVKMTFIEFRKKTTAGITIAGSVFVALALIVIFGIIVGTSFNEIKEGLGNLSLGFAGVAFIVIIIIAVIAILKD
jgi:hypothetical protein